MNTLRGRTAAVTGAASGLGRAMALAFADEGMHLALADVDEKGLALTKEEIERKGVKASSTRVDVSRASDVDAFAASLKELHVVCNNAGVSPVGPLWENTTADWQWALGVNLWGVIHGVRAFVPRLVAQGEGHVVNTASVAGLISPPGMGEYQIYYAFSELWFDTPQDLWVAIGSDDQSQVWIEDHLIWKSSNAHKDWNAVEGFRKVHFKQGRNRVLVRLENGHGQGGFSFIVNLDPAFGPDPAK